MRHLQPVTFDRKGRAPEDLRDFRPKLPKTEEEDEAVEAKEQLVKERPKGVGSRKLPSKP